MRPLNIVFVLSSILSCPGLAGCSKETIQVTYRHDTTGIVLKVCAETLDFQLRLKDNLKLSSLGNTSYPDGNFTMVLTAPLAFAVDGHSFLFTGGKLGSGSTNYGSILKGQSVIISRKGVFVNGMLRGAFPP